VIWGGEKKIFTQMVLRGGHGTRFRTPLRRTGRAAEGFFRGKKAREPLVTSGGPFRALTLSGRPEAVQRREKKQGGGDHFVKMRYMGSIASRDPWEV